MFLEILLSLTTISFFSLFALRPTALTISQLLKDIKMKEGTVAKMEQKIENLETAQLLLENENARLPIINSAVPNSPKPDVFSRQIEALASKNSVTILGISIGETVLLGKPLTQKVSKEFTPLPQDSLGMDFTVNAKGSYQNLFTFLKEIENLRLPVLIDSVGLNLSKSEEEKILTLVVSGRTPYLGANPEK